MELNNNLIDNAFQINEVGYTWEAPVNWVCAGSSSASFKNDFYEVYTSNTQSNAVIKKPGTYLLYGKSRFVSTSGQSGSGCTGFWNTEKGQCLNNGKAMAYTYVYSTIPSDANLTTILKLTESETPFNVQYVIGKAGNGATIYDVGAAGFWGCIRIGD